MSSQTPDPGPVGSLAEEAIKLIQAFAGAADGGSAASGESAGSGEDHPSSCTYCPVCQLISYVRETSPEVGEHLASSMESLGLAARGLLDALAAHSGPPTTTREPGVQNIDLSEDEPWD